MKEHLSQAKEDYLREGQKTYIAINAAGAAAMLAFLQAIWEKSGATQLRCFVLFGIIAFTVGVAVATTSFMVRHRAFTSGASDESKFLYRLAYRYIPVASILSFCTGMMLPVVGSFISLYSAQP
jgi:hypothetical protein